MNPSLFPIEPNDPDTIEASAQHTVRVAAALAFNDAYLSVFYRVKLPAILASRDTVRIRLFLDWWIVHPSGMFYDGYTRPALVFIEREWLWLAELFNSPGLINSEIDIADSYCQAVRWHIEAVRAILEK